MHKVNTRFFLKSWYIETMLLNDDFTELEKHCYVNCLEVILARVYESHERLEHATITPFDAAGVGGRRD